MGYEKTPNPFIHKRRGQPKNPGGLTSLLTTMARASKEPAFKNLPLMSEAERIVGRVIAIADDNQVLASGSCVRIASGLYLTAAHVVQDFLHNFGDTNKHCNFSIWIAHIHSGSVMEIWALDKLWLPGNTDIAVMHAIPYMEGTRKLVGVNVVGINLEPPAVGSRIFGFGFHSSKGKISRDGDGRIQLDIWGQPASTVGEIREVHPIRRDSHHLNFPCFQVNARFDGGMSGGPIFSDNGKLCGIICTNFAIHGEETEHISYGATLWPIMGTPLDIDICTCLPCEPYCLIELAKRELIWVENWPTISATLLAGTGFSVTYRPNPTATEN